MPHFRLVPQYLLFHINNPRALCIHPVTCIDLRLSWRRGQPHMADDEDTNTPPCRSNRGMRAHVLPLRIVGGIDRGYGDGNSGNTSRSGNTTGTDEAVQILVSRLAGNDPRSLLLHMAWSGIRLLVHSFGHCQHSELPTKRCRSTFAIDRSNIRLDSSQHCSRINTCARFQWAGLVH